METEQRRIIVQKTESVFYLRGRKNRGKKILYALADLNNTVVRTVLGDEQYGHWELLCHLCPVAAGNRFSHVITSGALEVSAEENEKNQTQRRL